jgi:hypothetical protein
MNDAAATTHKTLYRWDKRPSVLDQPPKATKQGENDEHGCLSTVCSRVICSI